MKIKIKYKRFTQNMWQLTFESSAKSLEKKIQARLSDLTCRSTNNKVLKEIDWNYLNLVRWKSYILKWELDIGNPWEKKIRSTILWSDWVK